MQKVCLACLQPLVGLQRKWCSDKCAWRGNRNFRQRKKIDARTWIPQSICVRCGQSIEGRGPQAKYCSTRCKWDSDHELQTLRLRQRRAAEGKPLPGDIVPCGNSMCGNQATYVSGQPYCAPRCRNIANRYRVEGMWPTGPHSRIYIDGCPDCGVLVTRKSRVPKRCQPCSQIANRAIDARKNHKRRAAGRIEMSIRDLANRDGERCHLCRRKIDTTLPGTAKWGATIDHILPVSCGGTNEASNLALAHRHCNTARGNRQPAQMLLTA